MHVRHEALFQLADGAVPGDPAVRALPPRRSVVLPVDGARAGAGQDLLPLLEPALHAASTATPRSASSRCARATPPTSSASRAASVADELERLGRRYALPARATRSAPRARRLVNLLRPRPAGTDVDPGPGARLSRITWRILWWRSNSSPSAAPRRVADLGSGAGFPGLPLAIALPGRGFTRGERPQEVRVHRPRDLGVRRRQRVLGERPGRGLARRPRALRSRHRSRPGAARGRGRVRRAACSPWAARPSSGGVDVIPRMRRRRTRGRTSSAWNSVKSRRCSHIRPPHRHLHLMSKVMETPSRFPRRPAWPASARWGARRQADVRDLTAPAASLPCHGDRLRDRQPEGRRRQDDDRGQPGCLRGRGGLRDAARRHRSPGKRDHRPRLRQGLRPDRLRRPRRGSCRWRMSSVPTAIEHLSIAPAGPDLAGATVELPRSPARRPGCARRWPSRASGTRSRSSIARRRSGRSRSTHWWRPTG